MPGLPMYLYESDVDVLVEHLGDDDEIAWLAQIDSSQGDWKAETT